MKIVHTLQFLGIGGLEKIVFQLASEQIRLGHSVSVYVYDYERSWVDYFIKNGITVITPPIKKPGYDWSLFTRFEEELFTYDIIHTHDLNPLMYLGPLIFSKKFTRKECPKLIHTTHGMDHIKNYKRANLYEKIVSRLADKVIAVSDKIGKYYLEDVRLSSKKVIVIPNGIELFKKNITKELRQEKKEWIINRHQLMLDRPIILSLSRVVPLKDQLFLINCFKKRPDLQLIIAGPPSDPEYYKQCENSLTTNIQMIGSQENVHDYNLGSDLYVSASTHEGIPVAVLEAMAVETPVLVSDIPGHITLNQHGESISTYTIHDQQDFLLKLDLILDQQAKFQEMAKSAKSIVENHFSAHSMTNKYIQIYTEVLKN